jgi:flagellar biosynthetic protein FliR
MENLLANFYWYLLLLARVAAIVGASPLLGSRNVPMRLKAGLAGLLSLLLLPGIKLPQTPLPQGLLPFALLLGREIIAGFLFGFCITAAFAIFQLIGQFIDVPIGFGMVNVLDPTSHSQMPIVGQFQYLFAMAIFLMTNGHHALLLALGRSLELIPLGGIKLPGELLGWGLGVFSQMFALGFQLSLPVVGTLFLTDLALAIVARTVPQMNVFVVGYPAKILIGLGVLALSLPLYAGIIADLFGPGGWLVRELTSLLGLMGR